MNDSLLKRVRCYLREAIGFSISSKTSIVDSGSISYDNEAADLVIATKTTTADSVNKLRKLAMVVSLKYRRRIHDKFAQRLQRDVRSARSIDVSRTAVVAPPATLNPQPNKGSPFVLMPPEIGPSRAVQHDSRYESTRI